MNTNYSDSRTLESLPRVIGHRGASGYAPENTLGSIRKAAELGARWVEVDVCVTEDDVPVLLHDDQLSRTTSGSGFVLKSSLSSVKSLDAGSWFGLDYSEESIPTLEEALKLCLSLDLGVNLEIKPSQGWEAPTVDILVDYLQSYSNALPILLSSFNFECLTLLSQKIPQIPRGYITDVIPQNWQQKLELAECKSLHFNAAFIDQPRIDAMRSQGYKVLCFTVNDAREAQNLFAAGIDAVFTDYPDRILSILSSGLF